MALKHYSHCGRVACQKLAQRLIGLSGGFARPQLAVTLSSPKAKVPKAQRNGDAGLDLTSTHGVLVRDKPTPIYTGVRVAIPEGHVGFICPRSGLAAKGITVTNAPGIIDSNYRGELIVLLNTIDDRAVYIDAGDRIAQLVIVPCPTPVTTLVEELPSNQVRGSAGFGSSGK